MTSPAPNTVTAKHQSERSVPVEVDSKDHGNIFKEYLVVIFFQSWTSWIHVLRYYGFVNVYCTLTEIPISRIIKEHYQCECITYQNVLDLLTNNTYSIKLILLEGLEKFVIPWIQKLERDPPKLFNEDSFSLLAIFSTRIRKFKLFKWGLWDKIKHNEDTGGVTSNTFNVLTLPHSQWKKAKPVQHKWFVADFLKGTVRGLPLREAPLPQRLIKISDLLDIYSAPSVFGASGWVRRRLTCEEILRCLDIPQQLDKDIVKLLGNKTDSENWQRILEAVPGKVLLHALDSIQSLNAQKVEETKFEDKLVAPLNFHSMISGIFFMDTLSPEEERTLKAVKADNADIPVKLWNNKVARGNSTEAQDYALETFREIRVIRWYRRHVFRSFLLYMKRMHGYGWMDKLLTAGRKLFVNSEIYKDGSVGSDALRRILNSTCYCSRDGTEQCERRQETERYSLGNCLLFQNTDYLKDT